MTTEVSTGKKRVVVFISGGGSNMLALAKAAAEPGFPAEIVAVIPAGRYSAVARSVKTSARWTFHDRLPAAKAPRPRWSTMMVSSPGLEKVCVPPASRIRRQVVSSRAPRSPRFCSS